MHFTIYSCIIGLLILYGVFIGISIAGWKRNTHNRGITAQHLPACSIVIAVRNEYLNLERLVNGILMQNNLPPEWELILIDDHSEDGSGEILVQFAKKNDSIRVFNLPTEQSGKKAAIAIGLSHSSHNIIIQTDADCQFNKDWISTMLVPFMYGADMVIGPVEYLPTKGIQNGLFRIEFLSMVISGAGLAKIGRPVFCNAANMAYRKDVAVKNELGSQSVSGDDVFLLHAFKRARRNIQYAKEQSTIVRTDAPSSIRDFIGQRIRWGSKAKFYTDRDTILLSLLIAVINITLATLFISSLMTGNWGYFALLFIGKTLADIILLIAGLPFFKQENLLFYVPIVSIIYPFYIALASIYSIFAHYEWKGRRHL